MTISKMLMMFVVGALLAAAFASSSHANPVFEKYSGNPVRPNQALSFVMLEDGIYKMWSSGSASGNEVGQGIYYATSLDGISWQEQGIVSGLGSDTPGSVIKVGDSYHMYYTYGDSSAWWSHLATSTDGVNWIDQGQILSESPSPWVLHEDGSYKMWYTYWPDGGPEICGIGYATSDNGVDWTREGVVLENGPEGSFTHGGPNYPCVVKEDGIYTMYFSSKDITRYEGTYRIGYTTSSDGINWAEPQLLLEPGETGEWDSSGVAMARLVMGDPTPHKMLYYTGYEDFDTGAWSIGLANQVPEPGTFLLLAPGLLGLAGVLRRRIGNH